MKKKQSKGQKEEDVIVVDGYSDGKLRKKRLARPNFSPNWYVYYYNSDLEQKRISSENPNFKEAFEFLKDFDPFNPSKPDPLLYSSISAVGNERSTDSSEDTIAFALKKIMTLLETKAIEGRQVEEYRPKSLRNMGNYASRYIRYCKEKGAFEHLSEYNKDTMKFVAHYNGFLTMIAEQRNTRTGNRMLITARNYKRNLGILGGFLAQEGFIKDNVFRNPMLRLLNTAKEELGKPKSPIFKKPDFEQIIAYLDGKIKQHTESNDAWLMQFPIKDVRLMVMLGFLTGLRRSEVIYLNISDVVLDPDPDKCYVSVTAKPKENWFPKTQKSYRNVPIRNRDLIRILKRKIEAIHSEPDELPFLFSFRGPYRYKPDYITGKFREIVDAVFGVVDPRHLHDLRHSWCSYLVNVSKANVYDVQKWAGHESIQTTLGYLEDDTNLNSHLLEFDGFDFSDD